MSNSQETHRFASILNSILSLTENDDGIKFNQKIISILKVWRGICQTPEEVQRSVGYIFKHCLVCSKSTTKLIIFVTSNNLRREEIQGINIKKQFLARMFKQYTSSEKLRTTDEFQFRNFVQMLGDILFKSYATGGDKSVFLVLPFLELLNMLTSSLGEDDNKLLALQIYKNGFLLKTEYPEKFSHLLRSVRLSLLGTPKTSSWLLFIMEVNNCMFQLPPISYKFYKETLQDNDFESIHYMVMNRINNSIAGPVNNSRQDLRKKKMSKIEARMAAIRS